MPLEQCPFPNPGWRDPLEIPIAAYVIYALLRGRTTEQVTAALARRRA